MFQKLRLWLSNGNASGLREAAREGAREAVREGTIEGIKLGMEDALAELTGLVEEPEEIRTIEARATKPAANGKRRKAVAK